MTTLKIRLAFLAAILLGVGAFGAAPASAQATRTWVSGVGDDVNPCSRTAPCKTFAGAISKTAAGGVINCLDPGGFGAVSIPKSMTIACQYTEGGALAGGNGITVNLPATTDVVLIRGLDIFGVNPPTNGIRFTGSGTLIVEDTTIRRFNAAGSFGISFTPTGGSRLIVRNSTIANNGNGATGGGILVQPVGAATLARVDIDDGRLINNANVGFTVTTTGALAGAGVATTFTNSLVAQNTSHGILILVPAATSATTTMLSNLTISNNTGTAIVGDGAAATIRVTKSVISGNGGAVTASNGSTIRSYADNRNRGNSSGDGPFGLPALAGD